MALIPYFKPVYPACTWRCQLCGCEGTSEEFITERVRGAQLRSEQGDCVFCKSCEPIAQDVVGKIQEYRAQRMAETERDVESKLPDMVAAWIAERKGGSVPRSPAAADEAPPTSLRRRGRPPKHPTIQVNGGG